MKMEVVDRELCTYLWPIFKPVLCACFNDLLGADVQWKLIRYFTVMSRCVVQISFYQKLLIFKDVITHRILQY